MTGVRVCLVDDDPDEREMLSVVSHYGADVRAVSVVAEALALVTDVKPDALVSDISRTVFGTDRRVGPFGSAIRSTPHDLLLLRGVVSRGPTQHGREPGAPHDAIGFFPFLTEYPA